MIAIRLSKSSWGKAWRAMIDVAPVRLVAGDPVFEVLPAHLELLDARGIAYEVVGSCVKFSDASEKRLLRHARQNASSKRR